MLIARRAESGRPQAEITVVPLVDIVLCLLIFFMVATTFDKDMKLEIERPTATSAAAAPNKAIRVYIDRNGETYIDGRPVKTWLIQSRVRDLLRVSAAGAVLVVTDAFVPAEKLIEVVDQCRLAGAKDVGVATKQEVG
jgi:biopolymer transport protein ExbD